MDRRPHSVSLRQGGRGLHTPLGQESAYLFCGPGDGGAVDAERQPEDGVREIMP
ncbi:hypothetical protein [Streptomyces sp. NPDC017202]|uniref:hypothetical protein n=1 Tax=Streptomyces sp. NPDC017202 TaxID=3364981 RepID=UPI0037B6E5EA